MGARARVVWPPGPVEQAPLAFVDLEMTGLDPWREQICEVCVLRCQGRTEVARLSTLVQTGGWMGEGQSIHGIDAADLHGAPTLGQIAPRLLELLGGAVLVAHGTALDERFLQVGLGRLGLPLPIVGVLDTLMLARRCFTAPTYRLGALCQALGIELPRAHRAQDDALATRELFWRACELLQPTSLEDLAAVVVGQRRARPHVVALAQELAGTGRPARVRYRTTGKPLEALELVITAVRADMDPPVVLGYLLPGRGRRELRADRILAIEPLP